MTYLEAIRYLESFIDYEKRINYSYLESFKLERIRLFLSLIGNPQHKLKCIHIAGTKGKGTACAFVAYMLKEAGYKVGLYTSPHLSDFRERIRILIPDNEHDPDHDAGIQTNNEFEGMISKNSICKIISQLKPAIDKFNKNSEYGPLTFFEIYTAIAFLYFINQRTDLVVLEAGLGGRLDATNVVEPLAIGITPISLEHTALLGNTLTKIAKEKTGIIKSKNPVVISTPQEANVKEIIRERCNDVGAKLYETGKNIGLDRINSDLSGSSFSLKGIFNSYNNLKIKLLGRHQAANAALALGIVESLKFYNIIVSRRQIRDGLRRTVWPGRFEVVRRKPLIILDGAQNKASSIALRNTLKGIFKKKIILILGISQDKDIEGILDVLLPLAKKIIFTKSQNPRAMAPENIIHKALKIKKIGLEISESIKRALERGLNDAQKTDLILVTGSLFLVGEAREIIVNESFYSPLL